MWCLGSDSNRHGYSPADFESAASTNFATQATLISLVKTSGIIRDCISVASKNFVILFNCIKFNTFDDFLSVKC